ncbi:hypothetical protein NIES2100_26000 [Calothrix sp. NIES-2100]|uniref:hypothetical protein n=1 Tax=Calothrix sp. NIES-2100 TaxID=1954172 RepID=UPI000B62245F|nr:hypothetical protein NIES2100_26000 [Calothrix sp. NIES-2100]
MKTETVNLPRSITHHLRITSIAILLISVYLVIPKTANTTADLSVVNVNSFSTSGESLTTLGATIQDLKKTYTPPNYGGPDSQHGSGTR